MRLDGIIERRVLLNYRVDPDVLRRLVPPGFRPLVVNGHGVAGVCLIRLGAIRPAGLPAWAGASSENAAHRIAVQWDTPGGPRGGVYIPRRDSDARLNVVLGGRLFPGRHHPARFRVTEDEQAVRVAFQSRDGAAQVDVAVRPAAELTGSALWAGVTEASDFFQAGSAGWSATADPGRLDGVELRTTAWRIEAAHVTHASSSWLEDPRLFPEGSAVLDSALLMRRVPVAWHRLRV